MIRLSLPKEPYWIDLVAGARVKVTPLSMGIYQAARTRSWIEAEKESGAVRGTDGKFADDTDFPLLNGLFNGCLAQNLARYGVIEIEGVQDADGAPATFTPDTAAELMLIPVIGGKFLTEYTNSLTAVIAEGNA